MNLEKAQQFLAALGVQETKLHPHGDWLQAPCPLAPWKHSKGTDSRPSFGINIAPHDKSGFNCFSCATHGSLGDLLMEVDSFLKEQPGLGSSHIDLPRAFEILESELEDGIVPLPDWSTMTIKGLTVMEPWPEWWLESFQPVHAWPEALTYLQGRGISPQLAAEFDARYDYSRQAVAFPIRDREGQLVGMRGRMLNPKGHLRYFDYTYNEINNSNLMCFNEHRINPLLPVILVEGMFDVMAVYPFYKNVISPLTVSMGYAKLRRLEIYNEIECFFDNDQAGVRAAEIIQEHFGGRSIVRVLKYPKGCPYKDPSELPREVLWDILNPENTEVTS